MYYLLEWISIIQMNISAEQIYMIYPTFFRLINDLEFTSFDIQISGRLNVKNPVITLVIC